MSKNLYLYFFSVFLDLFLFKVADNKGINNILGVFQIWPDWNTHNRVSFLVAFEHLKVPLYIQTYYGENGVFTFIGCLLT